MKIPGLIAGLLMICLPIFCQEGPIAAAVPNLEILEITLADQNGNMIIEANESCILLFKLKNSGGRSANSVKIKLTHIAPENFDINYRSSRSLLVVKANSIREVSFPIIVGDRVPESFVEFQIEVIEPNGFDAFPAKIELETAQGSIKQTSDSQQPEPVMVERKDTSTLVIKGFHFKDHNNNDFLEAYETSFFQFRLFNLGEEDVNSIHVHMEQTDDEISGINFLKSLDLDYYPSYYFQDISIPVKGSKNLADGMAEFQVYLTEESGLKSNHQLVRINTRKYERPDLKIINAEFSGQDGDRIRRNEPINLKLEIKNEGRGTAYEVESTLKLIYDHIELVDSDPIIRFEEIQGGETAEVNYQLMASSRYFLPELPVILELSEEISDTFLDTMFMASLDFPEEKKPETTTTKQEPQRTEEITAKDQEVTETAVQQISLPDLTTHRQEFEDEDNNNVINVGESCSIMFNIKNSGKGPANDVTVSVQQLNESIKGLHFPVKFNLGTIEPGQEEEISIPVRGLESLTSDLAEFRIEVLETRGFDAIPLVLEVKTQEILEPGLTISSAAFMNETGQLKRNYPIELRIALKNNGPGHASDLKIKFDLPDVTTCVLLGESDIYELEKLGSGESKTFSLLFTATRRYTADQIPVNVKISESHRKFGIDTVLVGNLNAEAQVIQKYQVQPRIIEKQVEEPVAEVRGGGDPLKSIGFEEASKEIGMEIGRYFALIIGIDNYKGVWQPLRNAVRDARSVEEMFKSKYKFDHVITLYNDFATGDNIIDQLEWLIDNATAADNILIFYSGHGEYNEDLNRGYWVPVDALNAKPFQYISNSVIQDYLKAIKSKHTLLISDACFSGDIFRGETISIPRVKTERYYRDVHSKPSRQAITSGGLEPVMDGGRDGHSVFTYYLLKSLETNENMFFDASQLYDDLKIPVVNNSTQFPEFQHLKNTGDEGGQFIFIQLQ